MTAKSKVFRLLITITPVVLGMGLGVMATIMIAVLMALRGQPISEPLGHNPLFGFHASMAIGALLSGLIAAYISVKNQCILRLRIRPLIYAVIGTTLFSILAIIFGIEILSHEPVYVILYPLSLFLYIIIITIVYNGKQ